MSSLSHVSCHASGFNKLPQKTCMVFSASPCAIPFAEYFIVYLLVTLYFVVYLWISFNGGKLIMAYFYRMSTNFFIANIFMSTKWEEEAVHSVMEKGGGNCRDGSGFIVINFVEQLGRG